MTILTKKVEFLLGLVMPSSNSYNNKIRILLGAVTVLIKNLVIALKMLPESASKSTLLIKTN